MINPVTAARNWLKAVTQRRPKAMSSSVDALMAALLGGSGTSTGVSVTPDSAMHLITVLNCVSVRAATISQLPLHLKRIEGQERNNAVDEPLYELLHDQPNSWQTAAEFWGMAEAYVCLHGNFLAYKLMRGGQIAELIPINWDNVQSIEQRPDYSVLYKIQLANGNALELTNAQVLHLRGLTLNGYSGMSRIEYARETIGLGIAGNKFMGQFFGKGMQPGAVIKHPQSLSPEAHEGLWDAFKQKYQGLSRAHELMLLDEGMSIDFPQIKLVDQQFLEQAKMNEAQICGLFRVPLMLIQSGDKTPTYASAEQFMLSFAVYGVTPDIVSYEKAIRRDLLTPEQRETLYAKFETRALLRSSFKEQMDSFSVAIDKEILSPNECRELMDMNPYDGGDEYRTRTSTVRQSEQGAAGDENELPQP